MYYLILLHKLGKSDLMRGLPGINIQTSIQCEQISCADLQIIIMPLQYTIAFLQRSYGIFP